MELRWVEARPGRRWIGLDGENTKLAEIVPLMAGGGRCWQAVITPGGLVGVDVGRFDSPKAAKAAVDRRMGPVTRNPAAG